jgi:protein-tyrosine phosphatase
MLLTEKEVTDGRAGLRRYARSIDDPPRILLLCTANQCRSPMAAALLTRRLDEASVPARVGSAGLLPGGRPAWPEAEAVMAERGIDISAHQSCRLDRSHVAGADLVLGMTREHLREAVVLDPLAYDRAFTLKELARRGGVEPRSRRSLHAWLATLSASREVDELLGADPADDVDDPIGGPISAFRDTADELDALVGRIVRAGWDIR